MQIMGMECIQIMGVKHIRNTHFVRYKKRGGIFMGRALQSVPEMAESMAAERDRNGYSKKLYKVASDEHKSETLQQNILLQVSSLQAMEERGKVDFSNMAEVRSRTYDYLTACAAAAVYAHPRPRRGAHVRILGRLLFFHLHQCCHRYIPNHLQKFPNDN